MQPITTAQLVAAGIAPTQAKAFAEPLTAACALHDITTPGRIAAFVAQIAHESANFTALEESLYYRTPERIRTMWPTRVTSMQQAATLARNPQALANLVYANRNGNGDVASGDGWRYRGRGLIQLTGRGNYRAATQTRTRDYEANPELVATPQDACLTAAWYWAEHGCNAMADASNLDAITRIINGPAMAGKEDRRENYREALVAFRPRAVVEA